MTDWASRVLPCGRCYRVAVENMRCTKCGAPHAILNLDSYNELCEHNEWAALAARETLNARSSLMQPKAEASRTNQADIMKPMHPPAPKKGKKTAKTGKKCKS